MWPKYLWLQQTREPTQNNPLPPPPKKKDRKKPKFSFCIFKGFVTMKKTWRKYKPYPLKGERMKIIHYSAVLIGIIKSLIKCWKKRIKENWILKWQMTNPEYIRSTKTKTVFFCWVYYSQFCFYCIKSLLVCFHKYSINQFMSQNMNLTFRLLMSFAWNTSQIPLNGPLRSISRANLQLPQDTRRRCS